MNKTKKQIKARIGESLGYYQGFPMGTYMEVLDAQQHEKVNSASTSSLLLTEFWQPANLGRIEKPLSKYLGNLDLETALKFFEFGTPPMEGKRKLGRSSMTDLMILENDYQIADEAKFTEYVWGPSQTLNGWYTDPEGADRLLRRRVAKVWLEMIQSAGCTDIASVKELFSRCGDIGYQFFHRTASACHTTNWKDCKSAVLLYQLFYKAGDEKHIAKMNEFKSQLKDWAKALGLKNMKFLIVCVPVVNDDEIEERFGKMRGQECARLFEEMKLEEIYKFDFGGIEVEDVALPVDEEYRKRYLEIKEEK